MHPRPCVGDACCLPVLANIFHRPKWIKSVQKKIKSCKASAKNRTRLSKKKDKKHDETPAPIEEDVVTPLPAVSETTDRQSSAYWRAVTNLEIPDHEAEEAAKPDETKMPSTPAAAPSALVSSALTVPDAGPDAGNRDSWVTISTDASTDAGTVETTPAAFPAISAAAIPDYAPLATPKPATASSKGKGRMTDEPATLSSRTTATRDFSSLWSSPLQDPSFMTPGSPYSTHTNKTPSLSPLHMPSLTYRQKKVLELKKQKIPQGFQDIAGSSRSTRISSDGSGKAGRGMPRLGRDKMPFVLNWLATHLGHIPHAVCGLAAMAAYGYDGRQPRHVSVICPAHASAVIRNWARATGMVLYPDRPDMFGIPSPDRSRAVWANVRIKYLREGFEDLQTIRLGRRQVRVLAKSTLIDFIAKAFMNPDQSAYGAGNRADDSGPSTPDGDHQATGDVEIASISSGDSEPRANKTLFGDWDGTGPVPQLTQFARDIFWLLDSIVEEADPRSRLRAEDMPNVRNPLFYDLFECMYPEARQRFAAAGFVVDDKAQGIERCVDVTPNFYGPRIRAGAGAVAGPSAGPGPSVRPATMSMMAHEYNVAAAAADAVMGFNAEAINGYTMSEGRKGSTMDFTKPWSPSLSTAALMPSPLVPNKPAAMGINPDLSRAPTPPMRNPLRNRTSNESLSKALDLYRQYHASKKSPTEPEDGKSKGKGKMRATSYFGPTTTTASTTTAPTFRNTISSMLRDPSCIWEPQPKSPLVQDNKNEDDDDADDAVPELSSTDAGAKLDAPDEDKSWTSSVHSSNPDFTPAPAFYFQPKSSSSAVTLKTIHSVTHSTVDPGMGENSEGLEGELEEEEEEQLTPRPQSRRITNRYEFHDSDDDAKSVYSQ